MIDLDQLLYGKCSQEEITEFFKNGEFYEENNLVAAIKKHLRTEEQRKLLYDNDLSIEDLLNGRVTPDLLFLKDSIFEDWNKKLGFKCFGY